MNKKVRIAASRVMLLLCVNYLFVAAIIALGIHLHRTIIRGSVYMSDPLIAAIVFDIFMLVVISGLGTLINIQLISRIKLALRK